MQKRVVRHHVEKESKLEAPPQNLRNPMEEVAERLQDSERMEDTRRCDPQNQINRAHMGSQGVKQQAKVLCVCALAVSWAYFVGTLTGSYGVSDSCLLLGLFFLLGCLDQAQYEGS